MYGSINRLHLRRNIIKTKLEMFSIKRDSKFHRRGNSGV